MRRLAWGMWGATLVLLVALVPAVLADPTGISGPGSVAVFIAVVGFILTFATVGLVVALRRPRNPIGWLLVASALLYAVASFASEYANYAFLAKHGSPPGATVAASLSSWLWFAGLGLGAVFPLLLFPHGHLRSPRWRPVGWMAGVGIALLTLSAALMPGRVEGYPVDNPIGIEEAKHVLDATQAVGLALMVSGFLASIVSLALSFKRSHGLVRLQLKFLIYAAGIIVAAVIVSGMVEAHSVETSNAILTFGLLAYPVALGMAMLKLRLYEIDVVINRTLVYGALTATLAATYLASVLVLQLVLEGVTSGSGFAVAVSTLAAAALFRPARGRIQATVDRRFYRRKYDAQRTLESFSARLREEVDLATLDSELNTVVREALQPAHISLWLRRAGS